MLKCPNPTCGMELKEGSEFCYFCKQPINTKIAEVTRPSQQAEPENITIEDYTCPGEQNALKYFKKVARRMGSLDVILFNWYMKFKKGDLIGQEVLVTEKMEPDIFKQAKNLSLLYGFGKIPLIYIKDDPYVNAYTSGIEEPFIVITTKLLDIMKPRERLYVLAHEFAHIKSDHVRFKLVSDGIISETLNLPFLSDFAKLIDIPIKLYMLKWSRLAEQSCDRAGFLIAGNVGDCCSALLKLELRRDKLSKGAIAAYLHQARQLDALSWISKANVLDETHPYGPIRLRELIRFASSNDGFSFMTKTRHLIRKNEIEL